MFHPADKMRGKVFEVIEAQMQEEIVAAQLAWLRKESRTVDEQPGAIQNSSAAPANNAPSSRLLGATA
jgi:hypothetical protein